MKTAAKEKLANVRMYGRRVSEFLLPDQMEFIETAMIEFAAEQANGVTTNHETALNIDVVSNCLGKEHMRVIFEQSRATKANFEDWYKFNYPNGC